MSVRKKSLCLLLFFLILLFCTSPAGAESSSSIRVLLRRLNLSERADLALTGRYLVKSSSGTELLLPENAELAVLLRDGRLILFCGGISADMGKSLSLLPRDTFGADPGIRFNLQSGFYPGDLTLSVEEGKIRPVLTLPLETYLQGVVPYEMGDGFPDEALKSQAVCARTYALSRVDSSAAWDVVDTTNDQVFRGIPSDSPRSLQAVEDTAGLVLTCDNRLITAYYSASNGGQTELPEHVWGGKSPRCFEMTDDPWDAANPEATVRICSLNRDATNLSPAFVRLLREAALTDPAIAGNIPEEESFVPQRLTALELITPRYPAPSRLMTQLRVSFEVRPTLQSIEAVEADGDLSIADLLTGIPLTVTLDLFPETVIALGLSVAGGDNEIITLTESDDSFLLTAGRYGHGVGLSQRGAQQMAREGEKTFREILSFYYPGAVLKRYGGEPAPLPTPEPDLFHTPGPAPTVTPRPTLMPVTGSLPEGAWLASVEKISEDSSLNLRAKPSAGAEILMRLYIHQPLVVLEESGVPGWVHVRTDSVEGYVMLSFLEPLY